MPGCYAERISINGVLSPIEQDNYNARVAIRAAFPKFGASILSADATQEDDMLEDKPCISISTLDGMRRTIRVDLTYLQIFHSSRRGVSV